MQTYMPFLDVNKWAQHLGNERQHSRCRQLPGLNMDVLGGDNSEQIGKKEGGTYGHRFRVRMHLQIVLDHNLGLGKLILSERENRREEKQTVATH